LIKTNLLIGQEAGFCLAGYTQIGCTSVFWVAVVLLANQPETKLLEEIVNGEFFFELAQFSGALTQYRPG
jgi:hypothetical protein